MKRLFLLFVSVIFISLSLSAAVINPETPLKMIAHMTKGAERGISMEDLISSSPSLYTKANTLELLAYIKTETNMVDARDHLSKANLLIDSLRVSVKDNSELCRAYNETAAELRYNMTRLFLKRACSLGIGITVDEKILNGTGPVPSEEVTRVAYELVYADCLLYNPKELAKLTLGTRENFFEDGLVFQVEKNVGKEHYATISKQLRIIKIMFLLSPDKVFMDEQGSFITAIDYYSAMPGFLDVFVGYKTDIKILPQDVIEVVEYQRLPVTEIRALEKLNHINSLVRKN